MMLEISFGGIFKTDILIVGGGLAGLWAALSATKSGSKVIILDKGKVGQTSCSKFASGDFKTMLPQDDFNTTMKRLVESGCYLGHQEWIETTLKESYDRVVEIEESLGMKFARDENGEFITTKGIFSMLTISTSDLMKKFSKIVQKMGVKIYDRYFVSEPILDSNGNLKGVIALSTRELKYCIFLCKAVVLACGSCGLRAAYFGHQFSTGDGYALALKAGASLVNMEAVNHNISVKSFDSTGNTFFRYHGARYLNCKGEEFIKKYNGLPLSHAMALEVRESNGPIYLDSVKDIMPWLKLMFDRSNFSSKIIECIAAFAGSRGTSAGVFVTKEGCSEVSGLFATGDTGAKLGNGMGTMASLLNCSVYGKLCGIAVSKYCQNVKMPSENVNIYSVNLPEKNEKDGLTADGVLLTLQKTILPMDVVILREEGRLLKALNKLEEIKNEMLPKIEWKDPHTLIKKLETENIVLYCEVMLRSALIRTESRGLHYREDYPIRDNKNWLKWIKIRGETGNLSNFHVELVNLPKKAFKYITPPIK
jgi:succinate dehydrogenase/fumarate reductase flavoprotein subunit